MKFSEMTYTRPDMPALLAQMDQLTARLKAAASAGGKASFAVCSGQWTASRLGTHSPSSRYNRERTSATAATDRS